MRHAIRQIMENNLVPKKVVLGGAAGGRKNLALDHIETRPSDRRAACFIPFLEVFQVSGEQVVVNLLVELGLPAGHQACFQNGGELPRRGFQPAPRVEVLAQNESDLAVLGQPLTPGIECTLRIQKNPVVSRNVLARFPCLAGGRPRSKANLGGPLWTTADGFEDRGATVRNHP